MKKIFAVFVGFYLFVFLVAYSNFEFGEDMVWRIEEQRREHVGFFFDQSRFIHNKFVLFGYTVLGVFLQYLSPLSIFLVTSFFALNLVLFGLFLYGVFRLWKLKLAIGKYMIMWIVGYAAVAALSTRSPGTVSVIPIVVPSYFIGFIGIVVKLKSFMQFSRIKFGVLGFILLAFVLRLVVINQSYWLDEAIGLEASRDFGYLGIVSDFLKSDNHPPLYYLNLKLWNVLFGFSEVASRSLSVLYGIGTVFVTYLIGLELFGKGRTAMFAAVFLATSQFHIYYSQEARMYAMAGFFVALAFYAFLKVMRAGTHWLVFSLSLLAMIFTDYMPVFMLAVFWLLAIISKKDKAWWARFVACHIPLVFLGLLWVPILQVQLKGGAWLVSVLPGWTSVAGGATLKQLALVWMKFVLGRVSLINKTTYYLLIFVASVPALYLLAKSVGRKSAKIWLWFVLPLGLGFVASFVFPAFIYFRFVYVVPALYLLLASGVDKAKNWRVWLIVILLVNTVGVSIYYFDKNQQREQWREAVANVREKIGQDEIVLFSYPDPFTPFRWYWGERGSAFGAFEGLDSSEDQTRIRTGELVSDKAGVYYFEYLSDITDPKGVVEARIAKEMRLVGENRDFAGVGGIYYWRRE